MGINDKPLIGISSCLLGQEVRYDGGHKHNRYITQTLGEHFEFVSWCPEIAIGLPVPRPPIRLVDDGDGIRVRGVDNPAEDYTARLTGYGKAVAQEMDRLSGYILKKDSPSCGMERVKVYRGTRVEKDGQGAFAREIMSTHPNLPFEEEGRLMDPGLRENFIERVFAFHRWQTMVAVGLSASSLVDFHTRHKFFLLAHDETTYRRLGRLVAEAGRGDLESLAAEYLSQFMAGLRHLATPRKHVNVLMHIMGFFKAHLDAGDKAELLEVIDAHRRGEVPVIVPITLINHHLRKYPSEYVKGQVYLEPHPRELKLRSHI
ncbi:MAG: DUF1722 domain-containing protein [Pseudomonadales bacterium]|nr:DUF1722 domain-containing protein [Pseudomonadales bacterium]